jgi:8-oxo-dGTP pyrophosphatase MutT (NUDIX family)
VVVVDGRVLLIERHRDGRDYVTLPGGKVKKGESHEAACVRELAEETGLTGAVDEPLWVVENLGRVEHYFLMGEVSGTVHLGGPEAERNSPENSYRLAWYDVAALPRVDLVPTEIRDRLVARFGG